MIRTAGRIIMAGTCTDAVSSPRARMTKMDTMIMVSRMTAAARAEAGEKCAQKDKPFPKEEN